MRICTLRLRASNGCLWRWRRRMSSEEDTRTRWLSGRSTAEEREMSDAYTCEEDGSVFDPSFPFFPLSATLLCFACYVTSSRYRDSVGVAGLTCVYLAHYSRIWHFVRRCGLLSSCLSNLHFACYSTSSSSLHSSTRKGKIQMFLVPWLHGTKLIYLFSPSLPHNNPPHFHPHPLQSRSTPPLLTHN